jgi:hypothetical protein
MRSNTIDVVSSPTSEVVTLDEDVVREVAYQLWILRARPIGTPCVDWFRAEQELKDAEIRRGSRSRYASA